MTSNTATKKIHEKPVGSKNIIPGGVVSLRSEGRSEVTVGRSQAGKSDWIGRDQRTGLQFAQALQLTEELYVELVLRSAGCQFCGQKILAGYAFDRGSPLCATIRRCGFTGIEVFQTGHQQMEL